MTHLLQPMQLRRFNTACLCHRNETLRIALRGQASTHFQQAVHLREENVGHFIVLSINVLFLIIGFMLAQLAHHADHGTVCADVSRHNASVKAMWRQICLWLMKCLLQAYRQKRSDRILRIVQEVIPTGRYRVPATRVCGEKQCQEHHRGCRTRLERYPHIPYPRCLMTIPVFYARNSILNFSPPDIAMKKHVLSHSRH